MRRLSPKTLRFHYRFSPVPAADLSGNPLFAKRTPLVLLKPLARTSRSRAKTLRLALYSLLAGSESSVILKSATAGRLAKRLVRSIFTAAGSSHLASLRGRILLRGLHKLTFKPRAVGFALTGALGKLPKPWTTSSSSGGSHRNSLLPPVPKVYPPVRGKLALFNRPRFALSAASIGGIASFPRIELTPQFSSKFLRSPFFFLTHMRPRSRLRNDILFAAKGFSFSADYLVFPDTNAIKVSIFRFFNRQKFLFSSRSVSLNRLNPFKGALSRFAVESTRHSAYLPHLGEGDKFSGARLGSSWHWRKFFERLNLRAASRVRIRRIRFKPGYGRI